MTSDSWVSPGALGISNDKLSRYEDRLKSVIWTHWEASLGSDLNGINFSVSHWLSSSLRSSALGLVMSLYFFGRRFLTLGSYRQGRFGRSTNVVNSLPSRAA